MNELFQFLERVGVPAGFAYVLLFRIEPELKKLTAAVLQLPERLHTLACGPAQQPEKTGTKK
jgi:hypothetical protein